MAPRATRQLVSFKSELKPIGAQTSRLVTRFRNRARFILTRARSLDSYWDQTWQGQGAGYESAAGFSNTYKLRGGGGARFVDLLDAVSAAAPEMRIRFTSPHPKDFPDAVLQLIAERRNICKSLHMPAQSGSSSMLQRMRRLEQVPVYRPRGMHAA